MNMKCMSKKTLVNIGLIIGTFLILFILMTTKVINSLLWWNYYFNSYKYSFSSIT